MANKTGYEIRIPELAEVETLLLNCGKFLGLSSPEVKLREWQRLSDKARANDVDSFRAVYKNGVMVAGLHQHPGGFITDIYAADGEDDALKILLRDMLVSPERHGDMHYSLSLANFSPRLRSRLSAVFSRAGYKKQLEHQVKCELIRLDELAPVTDLISFSDKTESQFELSYQRLTPHPWPWTIITRRAGGGEFNPDLWLLSSEQDALLGINEPVNNRTQGRIFNTVVALAEVDKALEPLMREALRRAATADPLGVVNAHVSEAVWGILEPLGFEIVETYPVFVAP